MALHKKFPKDKFQILDPSIRWFPADEDLRKECQKSKLKIAVKVIDIFGNDTTKVIEVNV